MGQSRSVFRLAAIVAFLAALFSMAPRLADAQTDEMQAAEKRAREFFQVGDYAKALAEAEQFLTLAGQFDAAQGEVRRDTVSALVSVSWYALFARQPEKALAASERAMAIEPGNLMPAVNRAHALLFLGRIDEARAAYAEHKGEFQEQIDTWDAAITNDFAEFRKRGLDHPQILEAEKALAVASDSVKGAAYKRKADEIQQLVSQRRTIRNSGNNDKIIAHDRRTVALAEEAYGPESLLTAGSFGNLGVSLRGAGRIAEAEAPLKRAVGILENHRILRYQRQRDTSLALFSVNLAAVYRMQNRLAEAEPLLSHAIALQENAQGASEADNVMLALLELGRVYTQQNRYVAGEQAHKRVLEIAAKRNDAGNAYAAVATAELADLYQSQGRYSGAEALLTQAIALYEKGTRGSFFSNLLSGPPPLLDPMLNKLAEVYMAQSRYSEVEPLLKRALDLAKQNPDKINEARVLSNMGAVYTRQGRYTDAAQLLRQSLDILEKLPGTEQTVSRVINNLAAVYEAQGKQADAEALYTRSLAVREAKLGQDHPDVALALNNLATFYYAQQRYDAAEPLFLRALGIYERASDSNRTGIATALNNLAELHSAQGRSADAEALYRRVLAMRETELGPDHADTGDSLHNLATFYTKQGRYAEALPAFTRSRSIWQSTLGTDHPLVSTNLNNTAELYFKQQDWAQAASYWQQSTDILIRRFRHGVQSGTTAERGTGKSEVELEPTRFSRLVRVSFRTSSADAAEKPRVSARMFEAAQWAQGSAAARTLALMAARKTKDGGPLGALIREQQDLTAEWQIKESLLTAARSRASYKRDSQGEEELRLRLAAIDARLSEIGKVLATSFPDYAAFASPEPLSLAETQSYLKDNEALVLFLDTPAKAPLPEETFIWVVTKTETRWVRTPMGTPSLKREVEALRCGLDFDGTWGDNSVCPELLGVTYTEKDYLSGRPLPFDAARAHELYRVLFGQVEDMIAGKRLLITTAGPLSQLPFQVLVTAPPELTREDQPAMRQVEWLVRRHSLTVLPAVSSLKALRRDAKASHGEKPYIGIGNPLLEGAGPKDTQAAQQAKGKQSCAKPSVESDDQKQRRSTLRLYMQGGIVRPAQILVQAPLPETADELCMVAGGLEASDSVLLAAKANETEIKSLSEQGALANYRVVHFATHGALAGQIIPGSEPGLILTPPTMPSDLDDGYLSASEIVNLKFDADWVILSACNTAAGDRDNSEALSGLARSFFYAGARSVLVSHWAVYSSATVKLVTEALKRMTVDTGIGRAEAMQQAMLALIDRGAPREAHPAYWAPFIVAGEGGR